MTPALNTTRLYRLLRISLFALLVALMIVLALQVKDTAILVLANVDTLNVNDTLCYSACTFSR
jgi:hypothetical protein